MPWEKPTAVKKAEKYVWQFDDWLEHQACREDQVGRLSRRRVEERGYKFHGRHPVRMSYTERQTAEAEAAGEYQASAAERVEAMTRPLPPDFVALCQAVYAFPGDRGPLAALADWLIENLGPTPVEFHRHPAWMKGRAKWEPLGFWFVPYVNTQNGPIKIDHYGRTMMYGREVFVSEPYATLSDALGMAAAAAPLVDAIVFATAPGDHGSGTVRIGIIDPEGIIPTAMRRKAVETEVALAF